MFWLVYYLLFVLLDLNVIHFLGQSAGWGFIIGATFSMIALDYKPKK